MAWIEYLPDEAIPANHRVDDDDNIIRIHSVHAAIMAQHHDLYREVMYSHGPLTRIQREMIGVAVSAANGCRY